jgi:hypothetical protein
MGEECTWCGAEVEPDDGFRAYILSAASNTAAGPTGERRAVFCRLEHLIPWSIQGAHWDVDARVPAGEAEGDRFGGEADLSKHFERCSHCGAEIGDVTVLLVRHRGEHRVADAFCSTDHMLEWAKAGGRWQ